MTSDEYLSELRASNRDLRGLKVELLESSHIENIARALAKHTDTPQDIAPFVAYIYERINDALRFPLR